MPSDWRRSAATTSSRSLRWPRRRSTRLLDFGQYKYELTKREKEAKRKSAVGRVQGGPPQAEDRPGRLRHEGAPGDRVPRGGRPDQGGRPVPRTRADPPAPRAGPPQQVRGPGQGPRSRRASTAPRRQVDAHHDRVDPQAEAARGGRRGSNPGGRAPRAPATRSWMPPRRSRSTQQALGPQSRESEAGVPKMKSHKGSPEAHRRDRQRQARSASSPGAATTSRSSPRGAPAATPARRSSGRSTRTRSRACCRT